MGTVQWVQGAQEGAQRGHVMAYPGLLLCSSLRTVPQGHWRPSQRQEMPTGEPSSASQSRR